MARRKWTTEQDALLGTMTDAALAKLLGVHKQTIKARRWRLGIAPSRPRPRVAGWTPDQEALLGTLPDEEVANHLGCAVYRVRQRRRQRGSRYWRPEEDALLGTMSDEIGRAHV